MREIQPAVRIFPQEYRVGSANVMHVAVFNANPASAAALHGDDWFEFVFDPLLASVELVSNTVTVRSPSRRFHSPNFRVVAAIDVRDGFEVTVVRVEVTDETPIPPGEGFAFAVKFVAPGAPAFAVVSATSTNDGPRGDDRPRRRARLAPISPPFTAIGFVAADAPHDGASTATTNVSGTVHAGAGATVHAGDGSSIVANGNVHLSGQPGSAVHVAGGTIQAGDATTVDAASGSTVNVAPGARLILPPGTTPAAQRGPNFLQIAASRWYEAARAPRFTLPAAPGALCFDGRYVWVAMSAYAKLGRIGPNAGEIVEVPLTLEQSGSSAPAPLSDSRVRALQPRAMVYDGEKLWISPVGVVRPDGTILANPSAPSGASLLFDGNVVHDDEGPLAFDGTGLWKAQDNELIRVDTESGASAAYGIALSPSAMIYDGRDLWLADVNTSTVVRFDTSGNQLAAYPLGPTGFAPGSLLFDGAHVWVGSRSGRGVAKLRAHDGALAGTFPADPVSALAFDGIHVWAASRQALSLARL